MYHEDGYSLDLHEYLWTANHTRSTFAHAQMGLRQFETAGNMYVAELGNGRVQVMDRSGQFIRDFGEGKLKGPSGLHIAIRSSYCWQVTLEVFNLTTQVRSIMSRSWNNIRSWPFHDLGIIPVHLLKCKNSWSLLYQVALLPHCRCKLFSWICLLLILGGGLDNRCKFITKPGSSPPIVRRLPHVYLEGSLDPSLLCAMAPLCKWVRSPPPSHMLRIRVLGWCVCVCVRGF